jgi:hypothetical protein
MTAMPVGRPIAERNVYAISAVASQAIEAAEELSEIFIPLSCTFLRYLSSYYDAFRD